MTVDPNHFDAHAAAAGVPGDVTHVVSYTINQETGEVTVHLFDTNAGMVIASGEVENGSDSAFNKAVTNLFVDLPTFD